MQHRDTRHGGTEIYTFKTHHDSVVFSELAVMDEENEGTTGDLVTRSEVGSLIIHCAPNDTWASP